MSDAAPKPNQRSALLARLYAEFPVFRDYRPLAIGIHKSLMERIPELDKGQMRTALHAHTAMTRYLKVIVAGASRFDLDGNVSGEVTAEQQALAVATLRERFKKGAERRKAELEAQQREEKAREEARQRQEKLEKLAQKFNPR